MFIRTESYQKTAWTNFRESNANGFAGIHRLMNWNGETVFLTEPSRGTTSGVGGGSGPARNRARVAARREEILNKGRIKCADSDVPIIYMLTHDLLVGRA